jgi:type II secretory pathway component HofQ
MSSYKEAVKAARDRYRRSMEGPRAARRQAEAEARKHADREQVEAREQRRAEREAADQLCRERTAASRDALQLRLAEIRDEYHDRMEPARRQRAEDFREAARLPDAPDYARDRHPDPS